MQTLPLATTGPGWTAACTLVDVSARTVKYKVANASVFAQVMAANPHGGDAPWGEEFLVTPEDNTFDNAVGVRFRDAVPGTHAVVVAQSFSDGDPVPAAGVPFFGIVSSSGQVTPPGSVTRGFASITWAGGSSNSDLITVPHGLTGIPAAVVASVAGLVGIAAPPTLSISNFTATTFDIEASTTDGSAPAAGSLTNVTWIADL